MKGGGGGGGVEAVGCLEGSYYTNETCWAIQEHQNCLKFGRPDRGFLKWRWKPYSCELPVFDPVEFLEMVRGKSLAFVGDSVARNHMQSLVCLLSRINIDQVAYPNDVSNSSDLNFKRYEYPEYNFTISIFWSPYLVNTERTDGQDITQPFKLYLDEFDESWTSQIENFNYVIISAGPMVFPTHNILLRPPCNWLSLLPGNQHPPRSSTFSYRRAWRTAFRAIYSLKNFKGIVFLRSFVPSHFEGGPWDKGGDCVRTKPLKSNESVMEDYNVEMYKTQLQEYKYGEREGRKKGVKITLMDMTQIMQLRPDGHPSKYVICHCKM
ncbi:putative PMR5 domain, PC-Esterase [Helianthus annuus]|nr:putative PMR5 domain, PC-Esterase [Helianthus annuus]